MEGGCKGGREHRTKNARLFRGVDALQAVVVACFLVQGLMPHWRYSTGACLSFLAFNRCMLVFSCLLISLRSGSFAVDFSCLP